MTVKRIFLLGASGTIGQALVRSLITSGHELVCLVRPSAAVELRARFPEADWREGHPASAESLREHGFRGQQFDVLMSCLASRTGAPADAWAIDYQAHSGALGLARLAGVEQAVQLSAICVQKPLLAFQQAKLAFEKELMQSGITYSIVRPTAFFKSLSGQIARVRAGKSFLVFGDGLITRCKPISDQDLASYMVRCIADPGLQNRVLPIGGPGPAITPLDQGRELFRLLGREPQFRHVPVAFLDTLIGGLGLAGRLVPALAAKAELARIGRYYATQSMLVWDPEAGRYDEHATPSTGTETLFDFYANVLAGRAVLPERAEHAVFRDEG
jgi:divinyl chlorophyllide a 8-vinyl-reductase